MTNEEKDLLIAYLIDTGDIDSDGDVAGQFLDWYQVREGVGSGETHYKAVLEAARVRARSFEEGRMSGLAEGAAKLGWDELEIARGLQGLWITSVRGKINPRAVLRGSPLGDGLAPLSFPVEIPRPIRTYRAVKVLAVSEFTVTV